MNPEAARRAFRLLFGAEMVSLFGSLVSRTALPFVAILYLHARPFEVALLAVADVIAGFASALVLGAWIDRLPKRPVMLGTDLARAALLALVPLGAWMGWLDPFILICIALACGVLNVAFELAYAALLPRVLPADGLLAGNSRIAAGQSVVETLSFGSGGWLVQAFGSPFAVLVDSISFVASAWLVFRVRIDDGGRGRADGDAWRGTWREASEGVAILLRDPILRALAAVEFCVHGGFAMFGATFLLYLARDLGFSPGVLGLVFAAGGLSSLAAATLAGRVSARFPAGPLMIAGLALMAFSTFLPPLATGTGLVGIALLLAQQLIGDGGHTIYQINDTTLRQTRAPAQALARVNAGIRFCGLSARLVGALAGGLIAEFAGARFALFVAAGWISLAVAAALASGLRRLGR